MRVSRAFTLLEVLIVVVILGILATVVAAQFNTTVDDTRLNATLNELTKLRRHVRVHYIREDSFPTVDGDGDWVEIVGTGEYLLDAPVNAWVSGPNARKVMVRATPDTAYHTNYGWVYDDATGEVWAAGFDVDDRPFPRP